MLLAILEYIVTASYGQMHNTIYSSLIPRRSMHACHQGMSW